ncbi:hypothetical protein Tco_0522040 [Tanacetum coccineum]
MLALEGFPSSSGGSSGGSVDVVSVVVVKLERASADAVRALKNFVLCKPWENEFESFSGQCLSEYILQLILCPQEIQLNHSLFHLFSDEMMSKVDVFRPGVLDVVVAESYGTLVVTIQRDVIVCKAIIR